MSQSGTPASDPAPQCSTEGCERTDLIKKAGVCRRCYQLVRIGRDPAKPLRNRQHGGKCTWPGGCDEPYRCGGFCERHYRESRKEELASREKRTLESVPDSIRERRIRFLWDNIDVRAPDECWPWQRKPTAGGYGQLRWLDGQSTAHRAVYEVTRGPVPEFPGERTHVDHTCHDPKVCTLKKRCPHRLCCNPAHLEAVPHSENLRRGETHRPGNAGGKPCAPGCTCKRHIPRLGGPGGTKCEPGCTCGRHRSITCAPGCTCGRHRGDEQELLWSA